MSKNAQNNKSKMLTAKNIGKSTLRCYTMTPCMDPVKPLVDDYKTIAIKFKDKQAAIVLATEILMLANTDEMDVEGSILNITAYRKEPKRVDGYQVTVTLSMP